jgi:hypothetical protein
VLLRLCEPFLDPALDMFWKRVDVRCVGGAGRLSFAEVRGAVLLPGWALAFGGRGRASAAPRAGGCRAC